VIGGGGELSQDYGHRQEKMLGKVKSQEGSGGKNAGFRTSKRYHHIGRSSAKPKGADVVRTGERRTMRRKSVGVNSEGFMHERKPV